MGKLYHFDSTKVEDIKAGDHVFVNTKRGREMGEVVTVLDDPPKPTGGEWKTVERKATPQELVLRRMWQKRELEILIDCRAKAAELELNGIKIARAEYSYDGSNIMFLYNYEGEQKIDIKDLRGAMRSKLRGTKVEFKQVGTRDLAKILMGMGACGMEERCCSKFLSEFSPISIKMAKAQGISLNPQEITGMCGRLRCCLVYEYEEYVAARKELPKLKKRVVTPLGNGRVIDIMPIKQAVVVKLEENDRRVEFLKHEIQPYDELKALQKKKDQPCDRHQNGECDCGKNG
jgi:cell fate regulator YaaT (PSP1 superfamily)